MKTVHFIYSLMHHTALPYAINRSLNYILRETAKYTLVVLSRTLLFTFGSRCLFLLLEEYQVLVFQGGRILRDADGLITGYPCFLVPLSALFLPSDPITPITIMEEAIMATARKTRPASFHLFWREGTAGGQASLLQ